MRTIEAAIAAPAAGGILICGAAGVGKSRIAREALSAVASRGGETRWTAGSSSARAIPLGAFTAWAPSGVSDTVQLLQGVIESLTAAPSATAVVVGVDDVHLLDDLSTFVVHQIVQRGAAKVILTVRDGVPIPTAVQEIWKDRPVRPTRPTAVVAGRNDHSAVGDVGGIGGFGCRSAAVEADTRQCSVSAEHRRAGGRRRPNCARERLLAVDR